jgi:hypothetical protein bpse9_42021|nr:MAG TPA: HD domain-containing protein [Caudoviricetes sp.]
MNLSGVKALPTGNVITLHQPSTYKFEIEEIAKLLAKVKRFNGWGISVAGHSTIVANILFYLTGNPHIALLGLLHDAQEGYVGDIATPVKDLVSNQWDRLEKSIHREILFQLNAKHENAKGADKLIKIVDMLALKAEFEVLERKGVFKRDDKGIWNETFKSLPTLGSVNNERLVGLTSATVDAYYDEDEAAFIYLFEHLIHEATLFIRLKEADYKSLDGQKQTCLVQEEMVDRFTKQLN